MSINPGITERVALGPDEGYDFDLVGVRGQRGPTAERVARRRIVKRGVRDCDITEVMYAGRDSATGDVVYLVTYKTAWAS